MQCIPMRLTNHMACVAPWRAPAQRAAALACVLAAVTIGNFGFVSPAQAQPALTQSQSDALAAYSKALGEFKSILAERRAQINSQQKLPNLPGQALYLARNKVMSAYKDLTDVLPA